MKNQTEQRGNHIEQEGLINPQIELREAKDEEFIILQQSSSRSTKEEVSPATICEQSSSITTSTSHSNSIPTNQILSSQRLKRLSRLQKDAINVGALTDQKRRSKPNQSNKGQVKISPDSSSRGSVESTKLQKTCGNGSPAEPRNFNHDAKPPSKRKNQELIKSPESKRAPFSGTHIHAQLQNNFGQGKKFPIKKKQTSGQQEKIKETSPTNLVSSRLTITSPPMPNSPFRVERFENKMLQETGRLDKFGRLNYGNETCQDSSSNSLPQIQSKDGQTCHTPQTLMPAIPPMMKQLSTPVKSKPGLLGGGGGKHPRYGKIMEGGNERGDSTMNTGRWNHEEHHRFLEALRMYGREWKQVQQHVATRTSTQARSHAQKFLGKLEKKNVTLTHFLDTYFQRPDELEDDFFSGVEDAETSIVRKRDSRKVAEQAEKEQPPSLTRPTRKKERKATRNSILSPPLSPEVEPLMLKKAHSEIVMEGSTNTKFKLLLSGNENASKSDEQDDEESKSEFAVPIKQERKKKKRKSRKYSSKTVLTRRASEITKDMIFEESEHEEGDEIEGEVENEKNSQLVT